MTNSRDEAYYALPPSMLDASSSSCEKMMVKKEGMIGDRDYCSLLELELCEGNPFLESLVLKMHQSPFSSSRIGLQIDLIKYTLG